LLRYYHIAVVCLCATLVAVLGGCAVAPERGRTSEPPSQHSSDPLIARLAEGGYVVYIRHGRTDATYQDKQDKPEWWKSCDPRRHRPLSDDGRNQMQSIGANMRALRIPVGTVITSEYCRAMDSGLLLQLMPIATDPGLNYADAHRYQKHSDAQISADLRRLLSAKPLAGKNTILVGHVHGMNPPLDQAFSSIQEAESVIVRPLGDDKFEVVGRVTVEKWALRK
jgi:phosphohistidine phosphatase SixA